MATKRVRTVGLVRGLALALMAASGVLAGCGSAGPSLPEPSPACGTFHVDVRNTGPRPVRVLLNGEDTLTVDPGAMESLDEYGWTSPGPWRVEIVDPTSGAVVGKREIALDDGPAGTLIEVRAGDGDVPTIGDVHTGIGC